MSGEQKILRATEFLWRFLWFCFYIILLPILCAVVGYYVFPLLFPGPRTPYYGAIFTLIGSLAFFYHFFKKYRKQRIYQDDINLFNKRISSTFILLLVATIMEPVGTIIALLPYVSEVIAMISLSHIYTFIWIYFYYQFFRCDENAKYTPLYARINLILTRSSHEMIYFGIYIAETLFAVILHDIPFIWLHAFVSPLLFFGLIWLYT